MGGEIHPTQDRDEPATAWEPPTDSHVEPGYEDGELDLPEMPTEGPTSPLTRRKLVFGALFITAALVGLYFLVPKLTGLNQTWGRLEARRSTVAGHCGGLRAGFDFRLCGPVPDRVRARRVPARLAGEHRDPARRDRRDPPARGGGRGGRRGHGLGAAPRRHVGAGDRLPDRGQLLDSVLALSAGAGRVRVRVVERRLLRWGADRAHADSGDPERGGARSSGRPWGWCRATSSDGWSISRTARGESAGWRRGSRRFRRRSAPASAPRSG